MDCSNCPWNSPIIAANFNREFSQEFARVAAPLDECRTGKKIQWTEERLESFKKLKELFAKNIELQHMSEILIAMGFFNHKSIQISLMNDPILL